MRDDSDNIAISGLIKAIASEMSRIADVIEEFPIADVASYDADDIGKLQSIDLCRQELKEMSKVLDLLTLNQVAQADPRELHGAIGLEGLKERLGAAV